MLSVIGDMQGHQTYRTLIAIGDRPALAYEEEAQQCGDCYGSNRSYFVYAYFYILLDIVTIELDHNLLTMPTITSKHSPLKATTKQTMKPADMKRISKSRVKR